MNFKDLEELGFVKVYVPSIESGNKKRNKAEKLVH